MAHHSANTLSICSILMHTMNTTLTWQLYTWELSSAVVIASYDVSIKIATIIRVRNN